MYNHSREYNLYISSAIMGNTYRFLGHNTSRYTCSKLRFGWSRSKVTLHEEQSTYSPLTLMLSDVFSPKFTSVTPRIFFIHAISFLVIGQEIWALHMTTKVVLRPFSFPATGIFMKIHTWAPRTFPAHALSLAANLRRRNGTSHEDQTTYSAVSQAPIRGNFWRIVSWILRALPIRFVGSTKN